jgi:hypothetical protein
MQNETFINEKVIHTYMVKSYLKKLEVKLDNTECGVTKGHNQGSTVLGASTLTVEYNQM